MLVLLAVFGALGMTGTDLSSILSRVTGQAKPAGESRDDRGRTERFTLIIDRLAALEVASKVQDVAMDIMGKKVDKLDDKMDRLILSFSRR